MVGYEEAVDWDGEGEDAQPDHEGGVDVEPHRPEVKLHDTVIISKSGVWNFMEAKFSSKTRLNFYPFLWAFLGAFGLKWLQKLLIGLFLINIACFGFGSSILGWISIRIQAFYDQKLKKMSAQINLIFFWS